MHDTSSKNLIADESGLGETLQQPPPQSNPSEGSSPDHKCPNELMPGGGIKEAGLNYVHKGISVVPVRLGTKKPPDEWSIYQSRLPDEAEIDNWFSGNHHHIRYQVAVVCGCVSGGLIIFDFDGENWFEALTAFLTRFPELQDTRMVRTGSGKVHLWVRCGSLPSTLTKCVKQFEKSQIELRANRHITVAPPSIHPNGKPYYFENPDAPILEISEERLNEIVAWMREGGRQRQVTGTPSDSPSLTSEREKTLAEFYVRVMVRKVDSGADRNDTGYRLARMLLDLGIEQEDAVQYIEMYQNRVPERDHEYTMDEALNSLHSAYSNESGIPWIPEGFFGPNNEEYSEEKVQEILGFNLTDAGNAETFHEVHKNRFVFVPEKGTWFMWDGVRWLEEQFEAMGGMLQTARVKHDLANRLQDQDRQMAIRKWCRSWEATAKIKSGLEMAAALKNRSFWLFDSEPYLLCCENGVVNLRTGEFRHSNHNDWLHKSAGVAYDPDAKCPIWEQFLEEIFLGNRELIAFIKRAAGYSLTGDTREQCFFPCWGTGANGKSTFLEILSLVLGEYGQTMPSSTLKEKRNEDIPNDIARTCGARLVKMIEVKERVRLNVERVKSLTGGDKIVARFLHKEFFEFYPQFKIWMAVNHKPVIQDTTESIWRRIMLIPFNAYFPPERQDRRLLEILREELSGILNWAIEGCLEWQCKGLQPPRIVIEATRAYRHESDIVGRFLDEECNGGGEVEFQHLYEVFTRWWREQEEGDVISRKRLAKELVERGYKKTNKPQVVYQGLSLKLLPERIENECFRA